MREQKIKKQIIGRYLEDLLIEAVYFKDIEGAKAKSRFLNAIDFFEDLGYSVKEYRTNYKDLIGEQQ